MAVDLSATTVLVIDRLATGTAMNIRTRKLVGTIVLLGFLIVYSLLALAVAVVLQVNEANKLAELAYYAIAGMLWVLPAAALISWMGRPDPPDRAG